jgi:hypothetical protein
MIDANAYHSSMATWVPGLGYVQENGELKPLDEVVEEKSPNEISEMSTLKMGNHLVDINTEMYNRCEGAVNVTEMNKQNDGGEDVQNKKDIPSLIIAATMDVEFAYLYEHKEEDSEDTIKYLNDDDKLKFQCWEKQVLDMETAAKRNPLRHYPLFYYNPCRYMYAVGTPSDRMIVGCKTWKEPFARIVGCKDTANEFNKIWWGFCLNPALGFRPFDEFCEYLPDFYKKCEDDEIPILARCVPRGIIAHDVKSYKYFNLAERSEKCGERHKKILPMSPEALGSSMYRGKQSVVDDYYLNDFYMNYGHPRNWIPVLKYFPKLRLCLSGFGGNSEWRREDTKSWAATAKNGQSPTEPSKDQLRPSEWIRCIIKLTRYYENVYADISGLNIDNPDIKNALLAMLKSIESDSGNFGHLKYKLIFGSNWYLTHLIEMANNMDYNIYCRNFRELFDEVDGTGKLWERVSLINSWNFYGLSKEKIDNMYDVLVKNPGGNVNCDMLKKMKKVFDDSELVEHIACRNKEESFKKQQEPENDDDLATFIIDLRKTKKLKWISQFDPNLDSKQNASKACFDACKWILEKAGLSKNSAPNDSTLYQVATEKTNVSHADRTDQTRYLEIDTEIAKNGLAYLDWQLDEGNPVIVGVDHTYGTKNNKVDHFIVIVGRGYDISSGKIYYLFYDVGTGQEKWGNNDNNRLYIGEKLSLSGRTTYTSPSRSSPNHYFVTQIRTNKERTLP